jgi:excinuclease UvrABC nuclease subunit
MIYSIDEYRDIVKGNTMGVYFLYGENKNILYIGKSVRCIRQRINAHCYQLPSLYLEEHQLKQLLDRRETYKYFSYIPMELYDIDRSEVEYIVEHKPKYNKQYLYAM